jgi:hypothetical protein
MKQSFLVSKKLTFPFSHYMVNLPLKVEADFQMFRFATTAESASANEVIPRNLILR